MSSAAVPGRPKRRLQLRNDLTAWGLLAPTLVFMLAFSIYPILRSVILSFFRLELGMREAEFIGVDNYTYLFGSRVFWKVMRNTGISALLTVVPTMVLGLLLALAGIRITATITSVVQQIPSLYSAYILPELTDFFAWLEELLATFSRGKLLKLGVPTVILGRPNVGKSSLLNALLGYDRAIVTDVAGTTRDTVEEKVRVGHVLLRLCDTAGIHQTEDAVEKIGVERARAAARQASLALLVLDGSSPLTDADREAMDLARQAPNLLVAVNKSDLPRAVDIGRLADEFDNVVSLSARSGEGVSVLCDAIGAMYPAGEGRPGELLTNARQADAVSRALASVRSARSALRIGMTPDVVLTDAEAALEALGELNGKHIRDDLIQTIFSRFCVGK